MLNEFFREKYPVIHLNQQTKFRKEVSASFKGHLQAIFNCLIINISGYENKQNELKKRIAKVYLTGI